MEKYFKGEPKKSDLKIVNEELPPIQNGGNKYKYFRKIDEYDKHFFPTEYLCKALYLSVDPYMKPYVAICPIGSTMVGSQVAE